MSKKNEICVTGLVVVNATTLENLDTGLTTTGFVVASEPMPTPDGGATTKYHRIIATHSTFGLSLAPTLRKGDRVIVTGEIRSVDGEDFIVADGIGFHILDEKRIQQRENNVGGRV